MVKSITFYAMAVLILLFTSGTYLYAEDTVIVPADSERWEFQNLEGSQVEHEVVEYLGQKSLSLRAGKAVIKDLSFPGGIIEFDMAFPTPESNSFYGAVWDVQSEEEFVVWYIRPHRNASDDDLTQTIPFYNNAGAWQLYWDGHLGHSPFNTDEWNHVKIIISGVSAEIYLNDMETPISFVQDFKRNGNTTISGAIGLKVYAESPKPAYYTNFSYSQINNPPMKNTISPPAPTQGVVPEWMVSDSFPESDVKSKRTLSEVDRTAYNWEPLNTDYGGVANIGRLHGNSTTDNTVFVRTTIVSDSQQVKKMTVGYSDWGRVYFNGKLIFAGDNEIGRGPNNFAGKRDYRFQGVMGYFDELYLPLNAGSNEIWIAVTDSRAGWGVEAMLENLDGITFDNTSQIDLESTTDDCMANYSLSDGKVHIPCLSIPDGSGQTSTYEVDFVQWPLSPTIFTIDTSTIKIH